MPHLRRTICAAASVAVLPLAACSNLTISQDPASQYARPGPYVAAGLSLVDERFEAFEDVEHDADEVQPGVNLRLGYRLHPRVAMELAVQTYAAFDVDLVRGRDGEVEGRAVTGHVKGFFSTSHYQPYALIGFGEVENNNSAGIGDEGTDSAIIIGFGADYYFDATLALFVEAVYYDPGGGTDDFDFLPFTVGVGYRF
jgi:opacity protein-like surface antigen